MKTKQKEIMLQYINKMQYYNAAEGVQWALEKEKREELVTAAQIDIIKMVVEGLDRTELKEFVVNNATLCSFSDFITDKKLDEIMDAEVIDVEA